MKISIIIIFWLLLGATFIIRSIVSEEELFQMRNKTTNHSRRYMYWLKVMLMSLSFVKKDLIQAFMLPNVTQAVLTTKLRVLA